MAGTPETLGSYRILRQLGAGAMGEVFLAEHRHLKRQAALKLLARELVDRQDLLERFFLEARATSAIAHPGIVQIFDCEVDPTGRPYIVMELLTGETLAALVARQGALPPLQVARLGRSLAEALDAAHAKGIVHRDLKPENIFIQPDPPDSIKVVDFGIAKLAGDLQAAQVHKTRSGAVMGTPLYMSPEQCRDSATIDFRTDIYSLGVVLFELLTGRPPFMKDNFGELLVAHLTEAPPDVRAFAPTVPAPLAEIVGELLRKAPDERPPSMRAVAERLMAYVSRMTTVPGAAMFGAPSPAALSLAQAFAPGATAKPAPNAPSRTTFGTATGELDGERPTKRRGPLVIGVGAVLLLGGGAAAALVLGRAAPPPAAAPGPAAAATAPTAPFNPFAPAKATPAAAEAPRPTAEPAAAPAEPAAPRAAATRTKESAKESAKESRKGTGVHGAGTPAAEPAAEPKPSQAAAETPAPHAAGGTELPGAWEGPWTDPAHNQKGRLSLVIGASGGVSGWMFNTSANHSYRMVGRMLPGGGIELGCQCPPTQTFFARGTVHLDGGDLKGQMALSSTAGVFGETRLSLRRTGAAR